MPRVTLRADISEGTICLDSQTVETRLHIEHTLFDRNIAYFGGCLMVTVPNQTLQLSMSNVTFTNNSAYVGGVMFTECGVLTDLACSPLPCVTGGNSASNYGDVTASPPAIFNISMPLRVRSGAPLPISIGLLDLFGQPVENWVNTVGTIDTLALLTGTPRTFYQAGAAQFTTLNIRGNASSVYELNFTLSGLDLFGNDIDTHTVSRNINISACEAQEAFDVQLLECACAVGTGLVLADNSCRQCTAVGGVGPPKSPADVSS